MPDDVQKGEVIETTVGEVAAELTRRGLDPHDHVTVTIMSSGWGLPASGGSGKPDRVSARCAAIEINMRKT